jgi:hypothetical protein
MVDYSTLYKEIKKAAIEFAGMTTDKAESYASALASAVSRRLVTLESVVRKLIQEYEK